MKRERYFLPLAMLVLMAAFAVGRAGFLIYNADVETLSVWRFVCTMARGLPLDVRAAAIILLLPALCSLQGRVSLRLLLVPYFAVVSLAVAVVSTADAVMYEFWRFKLSAVALSYAASPEAAASSVPLSFMVSRWAVGLAFAVCLTVALARVTPKRAERGWLKVIAVFVLAALPLGVGTCYSGRQSLFRNHASANSLYAFAASFRQDRSYGGFAPPGECAAVADTLYPGRTEDIADTLLRSRRPNILIVQMESFGGKFVSELGGIPGVAPNLSRLIPEGVFFTEYYSSSFRTDRGTVSLQSGTLPHPTVSIMREASLHASLPSLPRSLARRGYDAHYLYAGDMSNMGKGDYLSRMGFTLHDIGEFGDGERESPWGAHDGEAAHRLLRLLGRQDTSRPWFFTFQTLSSHEPWDVPYRRLADRRLNAFAYTDHCVGWLVDSLRASPLWDNLLIIIIPDHGYLYEQTYEDPEFFHSPMLWTGGAVRQPGKRVSTLMNQSDIAATLLSQLGIPHSDFPQSRNVLSREYTRPFVYCNYPAGIMLKDSTGVSIFDLSASRTVVSRPASGDSLRVARAKAILQRTHALLLTVRDSRSSP